jgi:ribosomal protein S18
MLRLAFVRPGALARLNYTRAYVQYIPDAVPAFYKGEGPGTTTVDPTTEEQERAKNALEYNRKYRSLFRDPDAPTKQSYSGLFEESKRRNDYGYNSLNEPIKSISEIQIQGQYKMHEEKERALRVLKTAEKLRHRIVHMNSILLNAKRPKKEDVPSIQVVQFARSMLNEIDEENKTIRKRILKPKVHIHCRFCKDPSLLEKLDPLNVHFVASFLGPTGEISGRRFLRHCAKHQRKVARAVKTCIMQGWFQYKKGIFSIHSPFDEAKKQTVRLEINTPTGKSFKVDVDPFKVAADQHSNEEDGKPSDFISLFDNGVENFEDGFKFDLKKVFPTAEQQRAEKKTDLFEEDLNRDMHLIEPSIDDIEKEIEEMNQFDRDFDEEEHLPVEEANSAPRPDPKSPYTAGVYEIPTDIDALNALSDAQLQKHRLTRSMRILSRLDEPVEPEEPEDSKPTESDEERDLVEFLEKFAEAEKTLDIEHIEESDEENLDVYFSPEENKRYREFINFDQQSRWAKLGATWDVDSLSHVEKRKLESEIISSLAKHKAQGKEEDRESEQLAYYLELLRDSSRKQERLENFAKATLDPELTADIEQQLAEEDGIVAKPKEKTPEEIVKELEAELKNLRKPQ